MPQNSDAELVALYQESRDHQYLTELFTRHSDIIYRNALRTMKNPADAEDIMQIAFIKMISDLPTYRGTGSVIGWMLQVVIHACYDRIRSEKSRKNRDKKIMSERTQVTEPKNYELTEMMETHLNKLPEIYKVPITLQIMDGLSIKEVSEALEIPEKTIRSQIARGLEKLKISLQNVGVTASITSMSDLLKEIQHPMTPEVFKSSQYFNSLYNNKAGMSAKIAITSGVKNIAVIKIIAILLPMVILSLFGWQYFKNKNETSVKTDTAISSNDDKRQKLSKRWEFEDINDLNAFKAIKGAYKYSQSNGLKNSHCLMTISQSVFAIDISRFQLPLKISYAYSVPIASSNKKNTPLLFKSNYQKDKNIFHFNQLNFGYYESKIAEDQNKDTKGEIWHNSINYYSENCIDMWQNGKRVNIIYGISNDNKMICFYSMDKTTIDNFVIESVDLKTIPDTSQFNKFVEAIPFRVGINGYQPLENEKAPLNLLKGSKAELSFFDYTIFEKLMGNPNY